MKRIISLILAIPLTPIYIVIFAYVLSHAAIYDYLENLGGE